jgi:hypothetical protein
LSGVSLTNNTAANCASISLTAGDWDVSGSISFAAGASTVITALEAGVNTTSSTFPATLGNFNANVQSYTTGTTNVISTPVVRESLASTTTVYLVGLSSFTTSTMSCSGFIRARRVR